MSGTELQSRCRAWGGCAGGPDCSVGGRGLIPTVSEAVRLLKKRGLSLDQIENLIVTAYTMPGEPDESALPTIELFFERPCDSAPALDMASRWAADLGEPVAVTRNGALVAFAGRAGSSGGAVS